MSRRMFKMIVNTLPDDVGIQIPASVSPSSDLQDPERVRLAQGTGREWP